MAHKWDSIGVQLAQESLVSQLRNSPEPDDQKMQQVLDAWMDSVDCPVPISPSELSKILESSGVGLHDVANDFDKAADEEHRQLLRRVREAVQGGNEEEKARKWRLAYKESLNKHGSVSVEVTPCILVGAPATGKSSLKHLLVHNTPKAVKTSTAVVDTPEVVTVSTEQYAVEGGTSAWQPVSKDVMGRSLQACVTAKAYDEGQYPELHRSNAKQSHQQMEAAAPPLPHPSTSHKKRQSLTQTFINLFRRVSRREGAGDSEVVALLDKEHSTFLHDLGAAGESIVLKDASFIHLLDTGGQPSFQDTLPLLLDVPCTYIQVFNAARDLDQPVPITYRCDDHTEKSLPPSAETGWEMMLRSFSSMHTMSHKSSKELTSFQQEGSHLPQFRIFVVGTFKDKLVEKGKLKEAAQDISKHLKELEGKPYYHCIKRDSTGQPFYFINNMAEEEDERANVNSLREHLSTSRSSFKLKVPVMWYICEQITRGTSQKFFRFQDLKAFCLKHKFIDANGADEQFHSLLKLFSLLGFYAFFDLKDVPDTANYVCTDKGVFVKEVSKLLAVQFLETPKCPDVEAFKQNGIISNNVEIFKELGIIAELNRSWFLAALEHVGLLARYASATNHSASYFMPIALPQGKTKLPDHGSVAPLCVTFTFPSPNNPLIYTDLPRGVFCRLAVQLSNGPWTPIPKESMQLSNGPWTPIPKESDRTTVKFHSNKFELYLTEAPGFIRLTPVLVEELEGKEPMVKVHKLCQQLYDTLHKSIVSSAEDVLGEQFSRTAEIVFGFECGCRCVPHLATPASAEGMSLICQSTHKRHRSLKKEQIWFSPVDGTELVEEEVDGCNMWVMEETGGPSSDPPQTGHLRQKVHAQQSPASSSERSAMTEGTTPPQSTPQPPQSTPPLPQSTPQLPQPTPQPAQPTPQPPQPTPQLPQPTPKPAQPTPKPAQPTPQLPQPTPQPAQPTPQLAQPTPQPAQPTPQPPQPTPQLAQSTPQPPQPTLSKKVPMRECNEQALIFLKHELKLNVKVEDSGMIDMLEKPSALGFLNRAEMQRIDAMTTEMDRMDKIIEILRGKNDKCFSNFCDILKESNHETWAESLRKKAEEFERTPPDLS